MRLTPELIQQAEQYVNPCRDRELNLRGYRIPMIENLGVTRDQFHSIDFSDNEIRKLGGFPVLERLNTLLLNNNAIVIEDKRGTEKEGESLGYFLPNLEVLILSGNSIQELTHLNPLASLKNLRTLSLLNCPVVKKQYYRLYVVHTIPQLKILDFKKIKLKEREEAKSFFKTKEGKQMKKGVVKQENGKPEPKDVKPEPKDVKPEPNLNGVELEKPIMEEEITELVSELPMEEEITNPVTIEESMDVS